MSPLAARFAAAVVLLFAVAQVEIALRRRTNALHARLAVRAADADALRERRARLRLDTGLAAEAAFRGDPAGGNAAADRPVGPGLLERAATADPPAAPVEAPLLWWR